MIDHSKQFVQQPEAARVMRDPRLLLAFGLGSGLSPLMPGTMGTLAAIPLFLALSLAPLWLYAILLLLSAALGVYLCAYAAKKLAVHDHPGIVWDEFVGFWLCMLAIPLSWQSIVTGFVLFRIFDMWKPWPISLADKHIHGGFGIMFDDILAGLAAWCCLLVMTWLGWF